MSAKWVRPGGIVVVDDIPEPSVYTAARDFLSLNPGWRALGEMASGLDLSDPFRSMGLAPIQNTGFAVLAAPAHVEIRDKSMSFSYGPFHEPAIEGFTIDPLDNPAGTLHAKVILRSVYTGAQGGDPETVSGTISTAFPTTGSAATIFLETPCLTSHDADASVREVELVLFWEGRDGTGALCLSDKPEVLMTAAI